MKYIGNKYGKWLILANSYTDRFGSKYFNCRCEDCSRIKCIAKSKVISGIYKCECENINIRR